MINNLVNLNYDICSKDWRLLEKIYSKYSYNPVIEGLIRVIVFSLKSILRINPFIRKRSTVFLVGTHNQNETLSKIASKIDNSVMLGYHNYKSGTLDGYVPSAFFYLMGWLVFPFTIVKVFQVKDEYQRVALSKRLERSLVSGSSIFVWKCLLRLWQPKMIVVSNDHNHWTRSVIQAASELGVKTSYIPHAYTSNTFPALECTYSFLDSQIQKNLYHKEGIAEKGIIEIVGAVRFEDKIRFVEYEKLKGIVVCFNLLDSSSFIEWVITKSLDEANQNFTIFVKPHPGDKDRFKFIEQLCNNYDMTYVSPQANIYDFTSQAQILVGGVTGAHIDALMYSMLPLSLNDWYEGDYYGLVEEGIVHLVDDFSDMEVCYKRFFHGVMSKRPYYNEHLQGAKILPSDLIATKLNMFCSNA